MNEDTKKTDIVYVLKDSSTNNYAELRLSLRTLKNLNKGNYGTVFIVSKTVPTWCKDVVHIKQADDKGKSFLNSLAKVEAACKDKRVSENFILMNDDFFILKEIKQITNTYVGYLKDKIVAKRKILTGSNYMGILLRTLQLNPKTLDFTTHKPIVISKEDFMQLTSKYDMTKGYSWRCLYGTEFQDSLSPEISADHKVFHIGDLALVEDEDIISIDDKIMKEFRWIDFILLQVPSASPYEKRMPPRVEVVVIKPFKDSDNNGNVVSLNAVKKVGSRRAIELILKGLARLKE